MPIQKKPDLTYADVTPKALYMGRRNFLLGLVATTAVVAGWKKLPRMFAGPATGSVPVKLNGLVNSKYTTTGEKITPENDVTTYNNYYEFGTDKGDPSQNAKNFVTTPWSVSVEGECAKPRKFTHGRNLKLAPLEERIYRHRCVEAWSIVVPWIGYSLSTIINLVQPTSKAKLRRFRDLLRSAPDAAGLGRRNSASLRRGLAPRRSDESAHAALRRHVRRDAPQSGRRARAHGDPLEVRI